MAIARAVAVAVTAALSLRPTLAAQLVTEAPSTKAAAIVRRDADHKASHVHLGAGGEILEVSTGRSHRRAKRSDIYCHYAFYVEESATDGMKTSNTTCPQGAQTLGDSPLCESAAKLIPLTYNINEFQYQDPTDQQSHIVGCSLSAGGQVRFNPAGAPPSTAPAGDKPICGKPRFILGTNSSDLCGDAAYASIRNESDCRTAVECMDLFDSANFQITSTEQRATRPKGCMVVYEGEVKAVHYNPQISGDDAESGLVGQPICEYSGEEHTAT